MKPFYFDIETIPAQAPEVLDEIRASITAPGQYSKPESIAKWLEENREREAEAQWLKTSFDGGSGHCVCISYALGDSKPSTYYVEAIGDAAQEREVLEHFFCALTDAGHVQLVGHNVIGFDIPFLWKRAMVLNVKPPFNFPRSPKPWSERVEDTMLLWDGNQRAGGSMDRICRLMGIPGKDGMTGADVWPTIRDGGSAGLVTVANYCAADVERTRAMHKRMTFAEAA